MTGNLNGILREHERQAAAYAGLVDQAARGGRTPPSPPASLMAWLRSNGSPSAAPAVTGPAWPQLHPAAVHGTLGRFVRAAAPHTEADQAGILVACLVLLGGLVGSRPHTVAGNERHGTALFAVLVGGTSKGRKGSAMAVARALADTIDPAFIRTRLLGGFGSGEALVDELRDPADDGKDTGAADKRLCVDEPEFARLLKVVGRDGSILGQIVRHAWDGRRLEARSRARTVVASDFHVSALCQVTAEELRARLTDTETYGGTANRFLFAAVRRGELHPTGGNVPQHILDEYGCLLREHIDTSTRLRAARGDAHRPFTRSPAAEAAWARLYGRLADDEPDGLLGSIIARDAAQCLRLSLLYAVLDGAADIDVQHVRAAEALWDYSRASAAYVFGDSLGDQVADRLLAALRAAGESGLDRTAQSAAFGRHVPAARLDVAGERLVALGLAVRRTEDTAGRRRLLLCACEESASSEERGAGR